MTLHPVLVRSKNAGPFTLTVDVMFDDPGDAQLLYDALVSGRLVSEPGPMSDPEVEFHLNRTAAAVKITAARRIPAGSFGDLDLYGCQQVNGMLAALAAFEPSADRRTA